MNLRLLLVSIVLVLVGAVVGLMERYRAEELNRRVGIFAEMTTMDDLSTSAGLSTPEYLVSLRPYGLTGVVLNEQTLADLIGLGQVTVDGNGQLSGSAEQVKRVQYSLESLDPSRSYTDRAGASPDIRELDLGAFPQTSLRSLPVGIDPDQARRATDAGMVVIARHANIAGAGKQYILNTILRSDRLGATGFLPLGEQVLGSKEALGDTAEAIEGIEWAYYTPEFGKIFGDTTMVAQFPARTVRLHAAQQIELERLTRPDAIERFTKAAKERNIRALLVRPFSLAGGNPAESYGQFIYDIRKQLEKQRLEIGVPHAFSEPVSPIWAQAIIGLGIALCGVAMAFAMSSRQWLHISAVLIGLALVALTFRAGGRGYVALAGAVFFPTAAFLWLDQRRPRWLPGVLGMTAISLVGGLGVAGLLVGVEYMVVAKQFPGVKIAHFAPMLLGGLYFCQKYYPWRLWAHEPVRWLQIIAALAGLATLAFIATRTGNDNPAGVSAIEVRMRSLLDTILYVRPRSKEFMLGYPLLAAAIGLLHRVPRSSQDLGANGPWIVVLAVGGGLATTSVVNTMCHLHTPLTVSLPRIVIGLIVGLLFASVAWAIMSLVTRPKETPALNA